MRLSVLIRCAGARGRARTSLLALASLGVFAAPAGCARAAHRGPLKEAASADMKCPENQVHISETGNKVREVEGCGQKATYRFDGGDWRMIRNSTPAPRAPVMVLTTATTASPTPPTATPVNQTPTGTPSQPPPSMPPPAAGQKIL